MQSSPPRANNMKLVLLATLLSAVRGREIGGGDLARDGKSSVEFV